MRRSENLKLRFFLEIMEQAIYELWLARKASAHEKNIVNPEILWP
jgi:hypothetical protein